MEDPNMWMRLAEQSPYLLILAGLCWALVRACKWIASEILKPLKDRGVKLFDDMDDRTNKQTDCLREMTTNFKEMGVSFKSLSTSVEESKDMDSVQTECLQALASSAQENKEYAKLNCESMRELSAKIASAMDDRCLYKKDSEGKSGGD